jgi:hypothetical protein
MICPSCNKTALTFIRFIFSFSFAAFTDLGRGNVKCKNCGTSLRVTGQRKSIWMLFYSTVAILAVFAFSYKRLFVLIGMNATALYWVILIFLIFYVVHYRMWKYMILSKVDADAISK